MAQVPESVTVLIGQYDRVRTDPGARSAWLTQAQQTVQFSKGTERDRLEAMIRLCEKMQGRNSYPEETKKGRR